LIARLLSALLLTVATLSAALNATAQTEAADFSRIGFAGALTTAVSDYQCVGINPANRSFRPQTDAYELSTPISFGIYRKKRSWAFTLAEGGFAAHSDALSRGSLWQTLFQSESFDFTFEQKRQAAREFANNGLRTSVDIILFGAAYQSDNWGGIAVTARERVAATFALNDALSRLVFEGRYFEYFDSSAVNFNGDTVGYSTNPQPFSTLFEGSRLALTWYREYALSYGLEVISTKSVRIYAGASAKYLQGYAYLDAFASNGELFARSALSPLFGINYGKATTPSFIPGNDFVPVGTGWGADLGLTVTVGSQWSAALSVVDLGSVHWTGNVFRAQDTVLNGLTSEGFVNYNLFEQAPKITGDGNFFQWGGLQTATTQLPTRIRAGVSYRRNSKIRYGVDVIAPLNTSAGSLGQAIVSAGVDIRPVVWLTVSSGVGAGGNMGPFIPVGVMASLLDGLWEVGLQSRDILTLVATRRPVISLCIGLTRLRL